MGVVMSYLAVMMVLTGLIAYFELPDPKSRSDEKGVFHMLAIYYLKIFKPGGIFYLLFLFLIGDHSSSLNKRLHRTTKFHNSKIKPNCKKVIFKLNV